MNLRVILFLQAVVVLILCATGAKIKNKNMHKLIKYSVPIVLFVALMLCMSKTVEPYCGIPSLSDFDALTPASQAWVNSESPIKGSRRMGFTPNPAGPPGATTYGPEWIGSDCNNDSEYWNGDENTPASGSPGFPTGWASQVATGPDSATDICSQACTLMSERDIDGDSSEYYSIGAQFERPDGTTVDTKAAECILTMGADAAFIKDNFETAVRDYGRYTRDGVTVDPSRGKRVLMGICDKMVGAPTEEDRRCLGLDLPTQVGDLGYDQSCPGLHKAFNAAVAEENNCDNAYKCNDQCQYEAVSGYRGLASCPDQPLTPCTQQIGTARGDCGPSVDCEGEWSTCDENCLSTYNVSRRAARGGQSCSTSANDTRSCQPGEGACPTGGTTGGGTVPAPIEYEIVDNQPTGADSTVYRVYVNLVLGQQTNIYAIAGTSDTTLYFPPCIQDITAAGTDYSGINRALIANFADAAYDSWITVGITDGGRSEMSVTPSFRAILSSWNENTPLSSTNDALFWMSPNLGPRVSQGRICVAQLNIPNCVPNSQRTIRFVGQGRSDGGAEDWSQAYSLLIPAPAGGGGGCSTDQEQTTDFTSIDIGISAELGAQFRILQCLQDGMQDERVCPANSGCDYVTLDFLDSIINSQNSNMDPYKQSATMVQNQMQEQQVTIFNMFNDAEKAEIDNDPARITVDLGVPCNVAQAMP